VNIRGMNPVKWHLLQVYLVIMVTLFAFISIAIWRIYKSEYALIVSIILILIAVIQFYNLKRGT
jgi:hypothetical protein